MKEKDSPFVRDWENEGDRERYILHARESYVALKEFRADSRRYHVEYGKWLIASMLAIHGSAIYALTRLAEVISSNVNRELWVAAEWHVAGVAFIMVAGFMAWLNFQCAEHTYDRMADPAMLYRNDYWPKEHEGRTDPITATLFLAAASGILSFWCLIAGAVTLFSSVGQ